MRMDELHPLIPFGMDLCFYGNFMDLIIIRCALDNLSSGVLLEYFICLDKWTLIQEKIPWNEFIRNGMMDLAYVWPVVWTHQQDAVTLICVSGCECVKNFCGT